jgi:prolyl-tRNA synthetase
MGSYGVGVSRLVGAVAEATVDESGLCWPAALAPLDVHLVIAGKEDTIIDYGETLAQTLHARGFDVLLDDRPRVSPGVKFKDAELLGIPLIVVVGKRLSDGVIELRDRASGTADDVAIDQAIDRITAAVSTP